METFDHIIVGGGVIGASIAYHLTCKSAEKVLLLERNDFASAASSRAAGLILQGSSKPANTPLAKLTVDTIPLLEDELGERMGYHQVGSLRITASDDRAAELDAIALDASERKIPVQWPSTAEISAMVPWMDTSIVKKAAFLPTDGYVDPYLLTMFYIKAARARGVVVRPRTEVKNVLVDKDEVVGVTTNDGRIACGSVIDACGAWAAVFSERVGFPLPMAPVRSHFWIADAAELYRNEHPITVLPDIAGYTRSDVGGLVLGLQEPHSATFDARELPDDPATFSPTKGEEHWDILADAYEDLMQFFPTIESAQFSSYVCGLSSYTPDGHIILGPVPSVSGFYAAAGTCGSGITLSAGIGDAITDLLLGRQPSIDIESFRPDRFGSIDPYCEPFRERCAAARALKSQKTV